MFVKGIDYKWIIDDTVNMSEFGWSDDVWCYFLEAKVSSQTKYENILHYLCIKKQNFTISSSMQLLFVKCWGVSD